jgi:hypothetical protein
VCGDGLVWSGVEACDFGLGNDDDYSGCRPDCQWGPHCGDGILDPEHEACDRGDLNGTGMTTDEYSPCSVTCGYVGRVLFITSKTYHGALGGVSGADLKCYVAAQAAGLPNPSKYRAWISDEAMSPMSRLSQWDTPYPPIILVNGLVIADDLAELTELGPRTGISRTEIGAPLFDQLAWTNTSATTPWRWRQARSGRPGATSGNGPASTVPPATSPPTSTALTTASSSNRKTEAPARQSGPSSPRTPSRIDRRPCGRARTSTPAAGRSRSAKSPV